jgi:hypothetical protein
LDLPLGERCSCALTEFWGRQSTHVLGDFAGERFLGDWATGTCASGVSEGAGLIDAKSSWRDDGVRRGGCAFGGIVRRALRWRSGAVAARRLRL